MKAGSGAWLSAAQPANISGPPANTIVKITRIAE
jgi:hypothetical protein